MTEFESITNLSAQVKLENWHFLDLGVRIVLLSKRLHLNNCCSLGNWDMGFDSYKKNLAIVHNGKDHSVAVFACPDYNQMNNLSSHGTEI